MKYTVEVSAQARKQLKRMPKADKKRILDKIASLADNPRPFGYKKLFYYTDFFRGMKKDDVKIELNDKQLIVMVVEVTDRRDAY